MAGKRLGWNPAKGRSTRAEKPQPRIITATALRLDIRSRNEARLQRSVRQPWQLDAMVYRDSIPGLRYGINFLANCTSRMRIYPAALPDGGETDTPISLEAAGAPPEWVEACNQAMRDLGNGRMAMAGLLHTLSTNLSTSGECFLFGQDEADGTQSWSIRSPQEIVVFNDVIKLREGPVNTQGNLGLVDLDPEATFLSRVWRPHPFWRIFADSPMRALANTCENILIMDRGIRAIGRSRLASAGLLLMPDNMSLQTVNNDSGDPTDDEFFSKFADMMMTPITNEGDASAVVPGVVMGPGEHLSEIRRIDFFSLFDEHDAADVRKELIGTLALGQDIPNEVLTGVADLNHWSAWQVSDDVFRHHVEPHVILCVESLTQAFLRPYLEGITNLPAGMMTEWLPRTVLWYDPTELVTHPDQTQNAMLAHAALAISDASLRKALGFTEADAPTPAEIEVRMIRTTRTYPPNLLMALMHELDPALTVPAMAGPPAIPGVHPGGVDVPVAPAAPGASPITPTTKSIPVADPTTPVVPGPPKAGEEVVTPPITASMLKGADDETVQATVRALRFVLEEKGFTVRDSRLAAAEGTTEADKETPAAPAADPDDSDTEEEQQTGVMVAFFLPGGIATKIALDGGEPADQLHLTLAFLGEAADLKDPDGLKTAVKTWAAATAPIEGEIAGVGMFTAGPEPVTYVTFDSPELPEARQALIEALQGQPVATNHGYTPHITLDYADRVSEPKVGGEAVTFDTVSVCIAGVRTDFPMKPVLTASARRLIAKHKVRPSATSLRLSRNLSRIDTDLITKLTIVSNAAMLRVLEKAGAQVRTKVVGNDKSMRAKIAHTRAEFIAGVVGKDAIEAKGLTASALVTNDWSALRAQFMTWTAKAQKQALATAMQLAGATDETDAYASAVVAMSDGRDAAWKVMTDHLDSLAQGLLYSPSLDEDEMAAALSASPSSFVPPGLIRAAVGVSGGSTIQDYGLVMTKAGVEVPAIPLGAPVGGIGTGSTISGFLTDSGAQTSQYEWEHGPSTDPFDPHEDLDGEEFSTFTDDVLINTGDWPNNQYFLPGDHNGCLCNATPLWVTQSDVDDARALADDEGDDSE